MTENNLRVGDAERDETTARLAEHFAAGRLDRAEFDARTTQALAARTRGELNQVMADLPVVPATPQRPTPMNPVQPPVSGKREAVAQWRRSMLAPWAIFAVFFVVLWLATGAGYFWPMWPIMGWGLGVALSGFKVHTEVEAPPTDPHRQLPGPDQRGHHHGHP